MVKVLVDAQGNIVSATLFGYCGARTADDYALKRAVDTRFEPMSEAPDGLASCAFGRLVFQWHTIAPGQTNSVSASR